MADVALSVLAHPDDAEVGVAYAEGFRRRLGHGYLRDNLLGAAGRERERALKALARARGW